MAVRVRKGLAPIALAAALVWPTAGWGQDSGTFDTWLEAFRIEALAAGIPSETFDQAFDGVTVSPRVLERDAFQPEFTRSVWDYLDGAVSDTRIATGHTRLGENQDLLAALEAEYGVDRYLVLAIWGLESSYGAIRGNTYIIEALATLAYDGRRAAWARAELIAALRILEEGNMEPRAMLGSWAGAMGHTQFIPSSYIQYAVDQDGDGRRDLINTHADALASTANYLSLHGWDPDSNWGFEIILPDEFDYGLTGRRSPQPMWQWRTLGVINVDGTPLPNSDEAASILVPAGARGPAFLVRANFGAIMRYNNSTSYALGIAHLADRLRGDEPFLSEWPRGERALTRSERLELQRLLAANGFNPGPADGIIGARTQAAVTAFQRAQSLPADGFVTTALLEQLRAAP